MMHPRFKMFYLLLLAFICQRAAVPLSAQQVGVIGTVYDREGNRLPGATVIFTRIDQPDSVRRTVTDAAGEFRLSLSAGRYRYEARARGARSPSAEGVIAPGSTSLIEIRIPGAAAVLAVPPPGMFKSEYFNLFDVNYFSTGLEGRKIGRSPYESASQIKFKVAVRYKLLNIFACDSCRSGGYVSYSQTSFWHLRDISAPFFDNNYSPGVLGYYALGEKANQPNPDGLAVYVGFFHESNGRDAPFSRGWNRLVAGASIGAVNRSRVSGSLSLWHASELEETNPDLVDFAGRGELVVYAQPFAKRNGGRPLTVQLRSRVLGRQVMQNVEANALIELPWRRHFTPSAFVQVFSGYAENLLTYDQNRTVVRAGIAVLR